MSENNSNFNENSQTQKTEEHSNIRYTYNPNSANEQSNGYNTDFSGSKKQKKKVNGNSIFVVLISVLLCITVLAAAISIYSLISGKGDASFPTPTPFADPSPTSSTADNQGSAFENVVEIKPSPTPQIIEGELLTPQQAAEKVMPSVVCIQTYETQNSWGGANSTALSGEGSGIICRNDGYIITNAHVIEGASSVQVVLYNGTICDAEVKGSDTVTDLALLKIDATGQALNAANFTSTKNCNVADTVLALGNPGGLEFSFSVTKGIISALNRAIQDYDTGYIMHCIQTDTAINPGNSGGPLIDLYGNVIGITSSKIVAEGFENLGFAITYDEAAPIINDLLFYGHVKNRATINITLALPSSVFRLSAWSSIPSGLCVTAVGEGSEAAQAGLKQYDIIYSIDGKAVTKMSEYSSYLLSKKPGDKVSLKVYRANISGWSVQYSSTPITIEVTLSEST
ncbi:MAG: trypsin-like peptidase domain-containing protein [Clostridia bacterium]|nr:trypsin-like peptidase domain-containing protein [Clostridia bacterium]